MSNLEKLEKSIFEDDFDLIELKIENDKKGFIHFNYSLIEESESIRFSIRSSEIYKMIKTRKEKAKKIA